EPGFDLLREHEIESLLTIANGYVGSRGSLAEGSSVSLPATFLAGAFEPSADLAQVPELVILPDWGRIRISIGRELLSGETGRMSTHRRTLDMRRGMLLREGLGRAPSGHVAELRTFHVASLADRHVLLEGVELAPQNFTGPIQVEAILSGDVRSASGASHWESFQATAAEPFDGGALGPTLLGRTFGGLVATMSSDMVLSGSTVEVELERSTGHMSALERCSYTARLGEWAELFRTVTLFTSRDDSAGTRDNHASMIELVARHTEAWAER